MTESGSRRRLAVSLVAGASVMTLPGAAAMLGLRQAGQGVGSGGMAFAPAPASALGRLPGGASAKCSRAPLSTIMMAKGGKKGGKGGKKKSVVTPPKAESAAPAPAATESSKAEAAAPAPATPAPAAAKKVAPSKAMVDDDGKDDPAMMSKAVALLDEGRSTLGDGLGFGPGPSVTFTGRNGGSFTMGENERLGYAGDAEIVKATSKTITVKLYGKFWGTRQWAFDAVSNYLMDKIPGVRVVIEDESQLKDLFIRDVFYSDEAWKIRQEGPQYVNERGIQVAQPVSPDGKIRDLDELDFEGSALQLGIEEMMKDALESSRAGSSIGAPAVGNIEKELATSQTSYFSEDASDDVSIEDDDNIESVTKVPLSQPTGATKVDKVMEANPMFQMMTEMLEDEPGAVDDIQEMLEKSNGNMFAIMSNPKFQSLAQKMMKNPELMQMMQDPSQVQNAMRSAQDLGITDSMGVDVPGGGAKKMEDKTMEIVKEAADGKPDWLADVEKQVASKESTRKVAAMAEDDSEAKLKAAREAARAAAAAPRAQVSSMDVSGDSSFSIGQYLEESSDDEKKKGTVMSSSSSSGGLSDAAKENLLYAAGGVFGVGMIIFFLALQLGIVNVPFLDAMGDVGGVSTPASRRMAPDAPVKKPVVTDKADETPF